ncbi:MAG: riboflavin biosynthesis protein RibD, partial [Desulfobacterales bacterium]|nr:riboflavin biosynthesis protein RibD [Desulfobacterales bacterium]
GLGKDPVRVIIDADLRIPEKAKVLNNNSSAPTFLAVGPDVPPQRLRRTERNGVINLTCPTKEGRIDLPALMDILGGMDITSLLVEGGSTIMGSVIRQRLVD